MGDVIMNKKKCNYLNELIPSIVFNSRPELWVNYLAINRDGTVVFFENHPNLLHNQWGGVKGSIKEVYKVDIGPLD